MPLYVFRNKESGEEIEEIMSISSKTEYLLNNPDLEQVITVPNFVSGVSGISHKTDSGFNDMLGRIADANPHSELAQTHGRKGVKETKTREAVNKQKERQFKSS